MSEARVEGTVAAAADQVFGVFADFGGLMRWSPGLTGCDLEGSGVGAVRTLRMGELVIRERLEECDAAARRMRYAIIDGPVPVRDYLATVVVSDSGDGGARIEWSSHFEPVGAPADQMVELFEGIYRQGIDALAKLFAQS